MASDYCDLWKICREHLLIARFGFDNSVKMKHFIIEQCKWLSVKLNVLPQSYHILVVYIIYYNNETIIYYVIIMTLWVCVTLRHAQ